MLSEKPRIGAILPFSKLPPRTMFKALKPDHIHSVVQRKEFEVDNSGTFVKLGDSHAVNVVSKKDAIFLGSMPCRIVQSNVNCTHMVDWKILNQGKTAHA